MSDSWWPEGYADPAFVVQRQIYGTAVGGDYVRGSAVETLPGTALRYPTSASGYSNVQNKAFLSIRPFDYITAEVAWGWPVSIEEKWSEVALVRSGFGFPTTVKDGQTVMHGLKADFLKDGEMVPPPIVYDQPLTPGQFYYYGLFFKTTPLDWVKGMSGDVLIPRNHHHAEHLWQTMPPFYAWTDSNTREGNGFLRQFLTVFGFEMDQTREFVEQWQETYHIDKSPMALLRRVGENFGVPYKAGVGDARYRSIIAGLPLMLQMRGTTTALIQVVEAGSKWEVDITEGTNLMLLPDDSDFFYGTGDWATLHPDTDALISTVSAQPYAEIILEKVDGSVDSPPPDAGRGVMQVKTLKAVETQPLAITCGDGLLAEREIVPLYTAVPVEPGTMYGFSISIKQERPAITLLSLLWFDADGQPTDYLSKADGVTPTTPADSNWYEFTVQGAAPEGATYLAPMITLTGRTAGTDPTYSPWIRLAGASVYRLGDNKEVNVLPPDSYLTMGDPGEAIGKPPKPGDASFKGFVLGTPS